MSVYNGTIKDAEINIKNYEHNITAAKSNVEFAKQHMLLEDEFRIEIKGKLCTERKAGSEALRQAATACLANKENPLHLPIGTFCGFELAIERSHNTFGGTTVNAAVRHVITYTTEPGITGDIGNVTRLENLVNDGIEKKLANMEEKLEQLNGSLAAALESKGKSFEYAEELAAKSICRSKHKQNTADRQTRSPLIGGKIPKAVFDLL